MTPPPVRGSYVRAPARLIIDEFLCFFGVTILAILGSPGSSGALVGAQGWGKLVGFDCLILSQIGLILTELC